MSSKFCCDLCGNNSYKKLYDDPAVLGEVFTLVECEKCHLPSTFPPPTDEFSQKLYSCEHYLDNTISGRYTQDESFSLNNHAVVLNALAGMSEGRKILDVGCGAGLFLEQAEKMGWDIFGLEPSTCAAEIAGKKFGDRFKNCFLADAGYEDNSFDVVTSWGVLEHVPSPSAIFSEVERILKPSGIFFTHVPNYRWLSLKRKLMLLKSPARASIDAHEHLHQFDADILKQYFAKYKFEFLKESIATPYYLEDSPLWVNILKRLMLFGVKGVFAVSGINYGGVLVYARKAGDVKN